MTSSYSTRSTYDMSKAVKERLLSAECIDYLDDSSRRLKKQFLTFPTDGAGLLNGSRWHGRAQPSKARVPTAPGDGKEALFNASRIGMANRKYAETDVLMTRPSTAPEALRVTKRMVLHEHGSFDSSLGGGAVHVLREAPPSRLSRGKGDASPDMTVRRTRRHIVPSITREHSADVAAVGLRSYVPVGRPGTADTFLAHRAFKVAELAPCKLETQRPPNPVCETIDATAARDMYYSRFDAYCFNKTKGIYGGRLRLC